MKKNVQFEYSYYTHELYNPTNKRSQRLENNKLIQHIKDTHFTGITGFFKRIASRLFHIRWRVTLDIDKTNIKHNIFNRYESEPSETITEEEYLKAIESRRLKENANKVEVDIYYRIVMYKFLSNLESLSNAVVILTYPMIDELKHDISIIYKYRGWDIKTLPKVDKTDLISKEEYINTIKSENLSVDFSKAAIDHYYRLTMQQYLKNRDSDCEVLSLRAPGKIVELTHHMNIIYKYRGWDTDTIPIVTEENRDDID